MRRFGKNVTDVSELLFALRHVENERTAAGRDVPADFDGYLSVAADKIRAEALVVLEGPEPVRAARPLQPLAEIGEGAVPARIRHFHCQVMLDLSGAVGGEAVRGDAPGFIFVVTRDDADADTAAALAGV